VFDGEHIVKTNIVFTVNDVQNTPPQFMGSMTGIVNEDDPVGTPVMQIKARDGDSGNERRIIYELVENPNNYFVIDINTGEIRVDKSLDREALDSSSGVLTLKVKAIELVNGIPGDDDLTTSVADVTITIRDVNDEAPEFNKLEYEVSIPENVPFGTPLANLNMEVKDTDTGPNSSFNIELLDDTGKFAIEPKRAKGHTALSIKVNSQDLDYENPNERKFLLLVVASEDSPEKRLSSTATVTVQVRDLNDNSPSFDKDSYTTVVSEAAPVGAEVITITARDRDSGDFGVNGIRYELSGTGAELFNVDPITGKITVAPCSENCIDYEVTKAYFLSYSATDNNGEGKRTVANLRITVGDANDNPPKFVKNTAFASINEGQTSFQPRLVLKATDVDESSILYYELVDGNINNLFGIDSATGEITVNAREGLRLDNIPTNVITLTATVTDGSSKDTATVDISVKDINDRNPVFEKNVYLSSVPENAPVGTPIEEVMATDADYGPNAEISYRIQKGAYNDFEIDATSGLITTVGQLDYDRRDSYSIEVVAVDGGVPALTGTTTLTVSVMNKNDKIPFFSPATQRLQITEDTEPGTLVLRLNATDPDLEDSSNLVYSFYEDISAVDRDGKPVSDQSLASFFSLNDTTGEIFVAGNLDRNLAAIVRLPVQVTDFSASPPQNGIGSVVITLVDINDFEPRFKEPWSLESPYIMIHVPEEMTNGTVVHKFVATDADSNIDSFQIKPKNKFFGVEKNTGNLYVKSRIDYEEMEDKRLTFDLMVFDTGIPQKSASALVIAMIDNVNDNDPVFEKEYYEATVQENSPQSTPVLKVHAEDLDEGEFGVVQYQLAGNYYGALAIDPQEGTISIIDSTILDRERVEYIAFQVVAFDSASESGSVRSTSVPVNISISDVNDNPPYFVKKDYAVTIVDNIPYFPDPSPIVQLSAMDLDDGINAKLHFTIVSGNDEGLFTIDNESGIVYPNASFRGMSGRQFRFVIEVTDEGGLGELAWPELDQAQVTVDIENVNTHKPEWFPEPPLDETIEIPEESNESNVVILKVNARDRDFGDNQRISYFLKDQNENVAETDMFSIDEVTGELRTKGIFDREERDKYELVLVARDHGSPVAFETLRLVTVMITDVNDNGPKFPVGVSEDRMVRFTVPEEEEPGYFVGRVEAEDLDEGPNGRVFYYIVEGNSEGYFSIDKSYGNIYTKRKIDRETISEFMLTIKATNEASFVCEGATCDIEMTEADLEDDSVVKVLIFIEDKNDNFPRFKSKEFFVGIPYDAKVGDLILNAEAFDPDLNGTGKLTYNIKSSNLYRSGSTQSSGSLVPSPFKMENNGRLVLSSLMAEFNQDRFVTDIEAKESESNFRAKARVHIWIYDPEQLVQLTISRTPREVNEQKEKIVTELRNVTQKIIVIDDIRFHVDEEKGQNRAMTDMFVHAVDPTTNTIENPEEVLKIIDNSADDLGPYYEDAGIHSIVAVASTESQSSELDKNILALIFLLILIFFGIIIFAMLCCCMKSWVAKPSAVEEIKPRKLQEAAPIYNTNSGLDEPTSPISLAPGGGTDNPLWIDQKYKAYEEQELTMTVFSDQENSVISGQNPHDNSNSSHPGSVGRQSAAAHAQQQIMNSDAHSNAYATINKLPLAAANRSSFLGGPPERDYATLEKPIRSPPGPLVPGIHSTPIHQDSFSRRFNQLDHGGRANGHNNSNFVINRHGEPELLADLI
jgi:hypothetical protein